MGDAERLGGGWEEAPQGPARFQEEALGDSLAVQWLGLRAFISVGPGWVPVWGPKKKKRIWEGVRGGRGEITQRAASLRHSPTPFAPPWATVPAFQASNSLGHSMDALAPTAWSSPLEPTVKKQIWTGAQFLLWLLGGGRPSPSPPLPPSLPSPQLRRSSLLRI